MQIEHFAELRHEMESFQTKLTAALEERKLTLLRAVEGYLQDVQQLEARQQESNNRLKQLKSQERTLEQGMWDTQSVEHNAATNTVQKSKSQRERGTRRLRKQRYTRPGSSRLIARELYLQGIHKSCESCCYKNKMRSKTRE